MNRSAYLTTGFAIKLFSKLAKADIMVHGKNNIPVGPTIFVINHFTRIETLLLPYYIYNLTGVPVWSLAAASLFKGNLERFFDLVGVVSTSDPKRDELIVRSLLTGEANWIIFPEGSMVKTKKIVSGGNYMITHPDGMHEPHTGAAALALRAELYRAYIREREEREPGSAQLTLAVLGLERFEDVAMAPTRIVPVNLTYYPIRAAENIASSIAAKMVKDLSERAVEEIMAEGTMLLSGVDLDVRFGEPLNMNDYLDDKWLHVDLFREGITGYRLSHELVEKMKPTSHKLMQEYMHSIYTMTTINHEHLFASFLRMYPFESINELEFRRRVYLAASAINSKYIGDASFFLHKSLDENQAHLLTDDRFNKYRNFMELAVEKGVVRWKGDSLVRDRSKLSVSLSFHKGRIDNPIEVMANEVEPLQRLQSLLRRLAWLPRPFLRVTIVRYILKREKETYEKECHNYHQTEGEKRMFGGRPYLLPALRRRVGIVLVHSYLSVPEEVRELAVVLRRQGYWVYVPRLPGHGTSAEDLAERSYSEWREAVENAYVLMSCLCKRVIVGGVGVGGSLALDLAARTAEVAGVFAVSPAWALHDYSTKFMPGTDVWNRVLQSMRRGEKTREFYDFNYGNPHVNYPRNPVSGIREVGDLLEENQGQYKRIHQPALIMQMDMNPVVDPKGTQELFASIGSRRKEMVLLSDDRHALVYGDESQRVLRTIVAFIAEIKRMKSLEKRQDSGEEHEMGDE